ncbi:hypothetical protein ABEL47_01620 [Escherichia coli]
MASKSWSDIKNNPEFSKETPETQKAIANDYFDKVIAPQAKANGDDVVAVRADFTSKALPTPKAPTAAPEKIYPVSTPPSGYDTQAPVTPTGALNGALSGNAASQQPQATQAPVFPQNMGQALAMRPDAPKQPSSPSTVHEVAERAKGFGVGAASTVGRQVLAGTDYLAALANGGDTSDSPYAQSIQTYARNKLTGLQTWRNDQASVSPLRKAGVEAGEAATPFVEGMLPTRAGLAIGEGLRLSGAGGETYENTGDVAQATKDVVKTGVMDLVAHKVGKAVGGVASPLANKAAGAVEQALPKAVANAAPTALKVGTQKVVKAATGATAGAATGYAAGFGAGSTNALAEGKEFGDVLKEGNEAGKENAKIGAVFGARGGSVSKNAPEPTKYTPEQAKATNKQASNYGEAKNSVQKNEVLNASPELKNHIEIQTMKENNIPIHSSAFRDNDSASMAGVEAGTKPLSKVELNTTVKDADGKKTTLGKQIKTSYNAYSSKAVDSINTLKNNVSSMIKGTNNEYNASKSENNTGSSAVKGEENAPLTTYKDSLTQLHTAYKSGDTNAIKQAAEKADHDYSQLPALEQQHINKLHEEVTGNKSTIDHVADAHAFTGVTNRVNDMMPDINKPAPQETTLNIPGVSHTLKVVDKEVKAVSKVASIAKQYNTRQQINRNNVSAESNASVLEGKPVTTTQRMILQSRNHPEANNPNLSRDQAQRIIQGRDVEDLAPQTPGQEKPTVNRYAEAKYSQNRQLELQAQRDKFTDPSIGNKLTLEDMRNPTAFKEKFTKLKQQDNAQNVEKIRAQNNAKATASQNTANVKHESAMKELDRWQQDEGQFIPQEYIDKAIEKSSKQTPEGARVLDASRVKSYAMREFESKGAKLTGRKDQFYHAIQHDLPDAVKAQAKQHVDRLFSNKNTIKPDEARQAWKDVYEMGAQHYEAASNKTSANTMRKLANRNVNTLHARELGVARSHISNVMKRSLNEHETGMTKQEQQDYIDHTLGKEFEGRKVAMTRTEVNSLVQKYKEQASKHAQQWASKSEAEKAKSLGANEESVADIDKNKPGKISPEDSTHILTDLKNNYVDAIVNGGDVHKLLASNKGIVNHLDQSGGKIAMHNRFENTVENIADRKDNMPKQFDKRSLVSREEYDHISGGNAQGYKSDLLKIAGVKDAKELLPESERTQLESDIKSGKQATRETEQKRKISNAALREKLKSGAANARTNQPRILRPRA